MSSGQPHWTGGLGAHPAEGDRVGAYELGAVIGAGGLATVFVAVDENGRSVAVKVLNPARVLPEEVKRFTREYRALSRMDHPNVVQVYDSGVHHGYPWIAMEYVDGHDLDAEIADWRAKDPGDRWDRVVRILTGLCRGLAYVHDLGLIHRDLKPSNVLLTRAGEPKISDFGVVKGGENTQTTQLTMAGRLVGTVAFMAPELITDEGIDKRTDLYALGAVLYLMCTFHRPIEADSVAGYLARHLTEIPRPAGELDPSVPQVLERVCARLLQKDRAYRYATAQAVLLALESPDDPGGPPLRGRDEALSRWTTILLDQIAARNGPDPRHRRRGLVVGLIGPVGTGRTHLLRALADLARGHGLRVTASDAEGDPLGDLADALGLSLQRAGDLDAVARGLGPLPTVLAIDDLDRADPVVIRSVGHLARLVGGDGPLLVLFTARDADGEVGALVNDESGGLPFVRIDLAAVEAKSVIAMLRDRRVTGPVAPLLARRLHTDYAGLPGPMMHQVDALVGAGWLVPAADLLRPGRPLDDFRRGDLPVPVPMRDRIVRDLGELDPPSRELCELLALLDRPAAPALLERCLPNDPDAARRLDQLVRSRVLVRTDREAQEAVALADPCAARVVRIKLDPDRKRSLHAVIAAALATRKRRANALEVARHLRAAGDEAASYPLYVQAARRAAREGRFGEVLETCDVAESVREAGEPTLPPEERIQLRRWLHLLRGEALLARRAWSEAVAPLQAAVAVARQEKDPAAIARTLGSLGRACYRAGRFAEAEPLLREALASSAETSAGSLRALADIALRSGRLEEAQKLWNDALAAAMAQSNKDAEARARRGLAHLRAIEGRLEDAADLLGQADDLLNPDGDYRVRAGVLARAIELDTASGRFGSALYRAESLVDLARRHGMGERLPEAYALLADLQLRLGRDGMAEEAAQQSLVFANATEDAGWEPRIRAARVLADLGKMDEALAALPAAEDLAPSPVQDPPAQYAALCARIQAGSDSVRARDLAAWALSRPPPLLMLVGTRIALDAARALIAIGQIEPARTAVKRGLKQLGSHGDGIRLELLLVLYQASPDARVADAIRQLVDRVSPSLPPGALEAFTARDGVGSG